MDIIKEAIYSKINGSPDTFTNDGLIKAFGEDTITGIKSLFAEGRIEALDGGTWIAHNPPRKFPKPRLSHRYRQIQDCMKAIEEMMDDDEWWIWGNIKEIHPDRWKFDIVFDATQKLVEKGVIERRHSGLYQRRIL